MAETIEGLGDIREAFAGLGKDMETRGARSMVVSAGGVLKREAKRLAQDQGLRQSGALINNIAIKRERTPNGVAQYHLGVRHGRDLGRKASKVLTVRKSGRIGVKYVNDPYYWWWVERGHKVVAPKQGTGGTGTTRYQQRLRNGKVVWREKKFSEDSITGRRRSATTRVPAMPFIQPSLENKREEAIEAMRQRLARIIEKAGKS